jgi:chromate transporter
MPETDVSVSPAPAASPSAPPPRRVPSRLELFLGFAEIAACGFGGVLAWARRIIVHKRAWMGAEEFNEQLALCQVLPGGNIVNFSIMFGYRVGGVLGSLAALIGLIGPPMVLMIIAGMLYRAYGDLPALRGVFAGLAAAAAGLVIATVAQMIGATIKHRLRPSHLVAALTFVAAGIFRLPLLWVMAVLVPVSMAVTWWERR